MPVVGRLSGSYEPHRVEEWVKSFWARERVYERLREWRRGSGRRFFFLDGPPYPSSDVPHAGTAWNKVLKDAVLRYRRMAGFNVWDKPGYDCHGLPIEVKVEQMLGVRVKREIEEKVGVERFIEECRRFALRNVEGLTRWFRELGVFMDWSNPYLTLRDDYIEAEWWLVKRAWEQGLLEKELRVVYWCPRCGTTLAEYEVEYRELEDPSIYVKFRLEGTENEYIVIWTTTPWTLPANAFVMIHPDAEYARVKVGDEVLIMTKARVEKVMEEAGVKNYEILGVVKGSELVGKRYIHPLEDVIPLQEKLRKFHVIIDAPEHVTLHEGTGLVHAAPGHGFEDYEEAVKRGWREAIVAPIDDEGRFTEEAGPLAGMPAREANPKIIEMLRERGALLHAGKLLHRYPVCWRCKTPVLLRATPQWVIRVTRLREKLLSEARRAEWIPPWAFERIRAMLENLQDWVLSRQRYWGAPLPVWVCERCGYTHVVGSVDELVAMGGERPKELHRPWVDRVTLKCPKCGGTMRRVPDVMDVWLDSGVAFYASRGHPERVGFEKADFITEGHDQTRGWFFSLLRAGVIGFGEVPYKAVLVHGFMLDEKGREMHKSLGNYVDTREIIERAGRDPFRFWVLQNTKWEDARFSWKALERAKKDLGVVWNVFVFASMYMSLDGFDPSRYTLEALQDKLRVEDRWILSRLQWLIDAVTRAMEAYRVHEAVRALREFILEDVSRWYIRLIRRRVWLEEQDPEKLAAYATLYHVLRSWLAMASVAIPFLAEYIYQHFIRPAEPDAPPSVSMLDWPRVDASLRDEKLEKMMSVAREIFEAAAAARMRAGLKLRQPVRRVLVFTGDEGVARAVEELRDLILEVVNAKSIEVHTPQRLEELLVYEVEPVYSRLGPRYKQLTKRIVEYLRENADRVARDIISSGSHRAVVDDEEVVITREDVRIRAKPKTGFAIAETSWGSVAIDTRLTEEEIAEGLARDVVRRIQFMRKRLDLPVDAYVEVVVAGPQDAVKLLEKLRDYIASETRASKLVLTSDEEEARKTGGLVMEWEIGDEKFVISVKPAGSAG